MKNSFGWVWVCVFACFLIRCTDHPAFEDEADATAIAFERGCGSMEVLEQQLLSDPKLLARRQQIERVTSEFLRSGRINAQGKIEIPVVVNVLYRIEEENISETQIRSQIDVLNEDFNAKNADIKETPAEFRSLIADTDIQFKLERINRKFSNRRSWDLSSAMKKSSRGGIDPTNPATTLNIWVVNKLLVKEKLYLGYAQFPGGDAATDGVVIGYNYFGRTGAVSAPFDRGRTCTHEVGHWMNLLHIWGDVTCGDDLVHDTPVHYSYTYGCPAYPQISECDGKTQEMPMNFMDYTDDACMHFFTVGQKARARALFRSKGARGTFSRDTVQ